MNEANRNASHRTHVSSGQGALVMLVFVVFVAFLAIGAPLPVLPIFISQELLWGSWVIGVVMGLQSVTTLFTRMYAGRLADSRGSKRVVLWGAFFCALSALFYLSTQLSSNNEWSLGLVIIGRVLAGLGESLVMTGGIAWGIGLVGRENTAKVISWMGLAMYGALMVIGAPIGDMGLHYGGASFVFLLSAIFPVVGFLLAWCLPAVPIIKAPAGQLSFGDILKIITVPGLGMALGAVGFAVIAAFLSALFYERGWANVSYSLMGLGLAYVIMRLFFVGLIQRVGSMQLAMVLLCLEACGQALIWQASSPNTVLLGAVLTGIGYSLILPAFSMVIVKHTPEHSRGAVMGLYLSFFDLALGITAPLVGFLVSLNTQSYAFAYAFGATASVLGLLLALLIWRREKAVHG